MFGFLQLMLMLTAGYADGGYTFGGFSFPKEMLLAKQPLSCLGEVFANGLKIFLLT